MKLDVVKPVRKYESVVILHPDLTEDDHKKFFNKHKEILSNFKGSIHSVDTWGKRRLANSIDKLKVGNYFHTFFEAEAESILELERTMRIDDKVLRFFHSRLDDRKPITGHVEDFRTAIKNSAEREQEREKNAQRKPTRKPR